MTLPHAATAAPAPAASAFRIWLDGFVRDYGHLAFVVPGLLFFVVFIVGPMVAAFVLSLFDWSGMGTQANWVGLDNFAEALSSRAFHRAAGNNVIFFVAMLLFQHTIGLLVAVQLNARPRFMQFYRTVVFLPVIISLVASGFIWTLLLSSNIGLLNPLLRSLGLGFLAKSWLSDPAWALPSVIVVHAWNHLGWAVVIYLTGLQGIPQELQEAAEIDGASPWQRFWKITFPLLAPSFTALTVLTFIQTFKVFDVVYVLTGPMGAPAGRTDVLSTLIYRTAFGIGVMSSNDARMSYAVAVAVLVFVVMFVVSGVLIAILRRREVQA